MKVITATEGQTVFDIALQEMGSIEGVYQILDINPGISLDDSFPSGFQLNIPDKEIIPNIKQYYSLHDIKPSTGLGEDISLNQNDMNTITQDVNYDLSNGEKEFAKVRLFFLRDVLTVQINYSVVSSENVVFSVDQSLDGVNFSQLPYSTFVLDPARTVHIFNIVGVLANFVRGRISLQNPTTGLISKIIWKT